MFRTRRPLFMWMHGWIRCYILNELTSEQRYREMSRTENGSVICSYHEDRAWSSCFWQEW